MTKNVPRLNLIFITAPMKVMSIVKEWSKNQYKVALILFAVASCLNGYGQNLAELEKRNGFKDIKLNAAVDSIKGFKLKKQFMEKDEFPAKLYTIEHPDYAKIGEVTVDKI